MFSLVWSFDGYVEVSSLRLGEGGQLDADLLQVQTGNFFVERLWQHVDAYGILILFLPEVKLRQCLVGEAR